MQIVLRTKETLILWGSVKVKLPGLIHSFGHQFQKGMKSVLFGQKVKAEMTEESFTFTGLNLD